MDNEKKEYTSPMAEIEKFSMPSTVVQTSSYDEHGGEGEY
jgi:hypothetical protein